MTPATGKNGGERCLRGHQETQKPNVFPCFRVLADTPIWILSPVRLPFRHPAKVGFSATFSVQVTLRPISLLQRAAKGRPPRSRLSPTRTLH
jgi:hypothetical protein